MHGVDSPLYGLVCDYSVRWHADAHMAGNNGTQGECEGNSTMNGCIISCLLAERAFLSWFEFILT